MDAKQEGPRSSMRVLRWHWRLAFAILAVLFVMGFAAVRTNTLGAGDRFDRLLARVGGIIHPAPHRPTLPTIVVTPEPTATPPPTPAPIGDLPATPPPDPTATPTPAPQRLPVDMTIVRDHEAVFTSQLTEKMCAVAGTQMVLTILGLGNTSAEFQNELHDRIGEWEACEDSHNGGWGPAAVGLGPRRLRRPRLRGPRLRHVPRRPARTRRWR